ncbi:MAG: polysaccharide biosynthesis C-terminal domain-containing protein [Proteobacteria bacterium]|nr:polysaccharide biosynthesis C-terminal domain-containing protein [Pseudomonadota bacterium]
MDNKSKHIGISGKNLAYIVLVISIVGTIFEFTSTYLLTRNLSVVDYGDFRVVRSFSEIGSILIILGGGRGALFFVPDWYSQNHSHLTWQYIRFYISVALFISIVVVAGVVAVQILLKALGFDAGAYGGFPLILAALGLPFAGASFLNIKILQVYKRVPQGLMTHWILYPIFFLTILMAFRFALGSLSVETTVAALVLAQCAKFAVQYYMLHRLGIRDSRKTEKSPQWRQWLKFSVPVMAAGVLQQSLLHTDLFMLELMGDEADVGLLGACSIGATVFMIIKIALSTTTTQYMKTAHQRGRTYMVEATARGNRLLLSLCLPVIAFFYVFGGELLTVFGKAYGEAGLAFKILMTGYLVQTLFLLPLLWLEYTGRKNQAVSIMISVALLNMLLNAILIPSWQINGAATSTAISLSVGALLSTFFMWKHLQINPCVLRANS